LRAPANPVRTPLGNLIQLALLVGTAAVAYALWLDYSPIYLHDAEIQFGLHARAIAFTAHDTNGRFMPVYFQMPAISENVWFHPFLVYWTAPWLRVLPFSEYTVRLPSVALGAIDIALMYAVVLRMFDEHRLAMWGAAFIAVTPAHFIHSRVAMDYLHPVPFILGWLWCLVDFLRTGRDGRLSAGAFILGVGVYSYIAAIVMMPVFLVTTWICLVRARQFTLPRAARTTGAFALPLTVALLWLREHPQVVANTFFRYKVTSGLFLNTFGSVGQFVDYRVVLQALSTYWSYFNPAYLFFSGGSNLMNSTRMAGVFLLPFAALLAAGIRRAWATRTDPGSSLALIGFLVAPLAAILVVERYAIDRALGTVPFGVLLGVLGLAHLRASRDWRARAAVPILLAAMAAQFSYFYLEYMTAYRASAAAAFNWNVRGVAESFIARATPQSRFFFSRSIPYAREYWRFALAKAGNEQLDERAVTFDAGAVDLDRLPSGSLVAAANEDTSVKNAADRGTLRLLEDVAEPYPLESRFAVYLRE
jgi:hypothetical protein